MIRFWKIILYAFFILFAKVDYAQEIRAVVEHSGDLLPKIEYGVKLQFRNDFDTDVLMDKIALGGELGYKVSKKLALSGGLRYTIGTSQRNELDVSDNVLYDKYRINADLKYKNKKLIKNMAFSNRLRFQHNTTEHDKDKFFLRDKFKINYKFSKKINTYFALEPYYSLQKKKFTNYRIYGGNEFKLYDRKVELFIILQLNNNNNWLFTNQILGLSYKF